MAIINSNNLDKFRWVSLAFVVIMMTTQAYKNLWSITLDPMIMEHGATDTFMATTYTVYSFTGLLAMLIGGKLVDKFGSNIMIITAAIAFFVGMALPGILHTPMSFAIGYALFLVWADNVMYVAIFARLAKLFPDKRGTTMSIAMAGISLGGIIYPMLAQSMIDRTGLDMMFIIMGVIFGGVLIVGLLFFPAPAPDYLPQGFVPSNEEKEAEQNQIEAEEKAGFVQKDWKGMLRDVSFYMYFLLVISGGLCGVLLISQSSWLAQDIIKVTPAQGAFLTSSLAISMLIGKLASGFLADKVGRLNMLIIVFCLFLVAMLGLAASGEGRGVMFIICMLIGTFAGGGSSALTPAVTADLFGTKNFAMNLAIVMLALPLGQAMVPWVANAGRSTGNFVITFGIAAGAAAVSIVIAIFLRKTRQGTLDIVEKQKKK